MRNITREELKEIFEQLEKAGMKPTLCDCPVEYYDVEVRAGIPTGIGEPQRGECITLPIEMVGNHPSYAIYVKGDSMKDAGMNDGDQVNVEVCDSYNDGDIVVASVNGDFTIKSYFIDADGIHWLVPCNKDYTPIQLTEDMSVRFCGRVTKIFKTPVRPAYRDLAKAVSEAMNRQSPESIEQRIERTIKFVSVKVETTQQWFAVYKGLVAKKVFPKGEYKEFALLVNRIVPDHKHPVDARELRRKEVKSFAKAPIFWKETDAPVTGKRFDDYLLIARLTMEEVDK